MEKKFNFQGIGVVVLVISDSCSLEPHRDKSGVELEKLLKKLGGSVVAKEIIPDIKKKIASKLMTYCHKDGVSVILTSGGTGFGVRDVTPEATRSVIEKEALGLAEIMRYEGLKKTKRAALSRGISGISNKVLIVNLPGSPKGACESFLAIADLIPHALNMIRGQGH